MTRLYDYLKTLIDESGTNIYQICKQSGLERTTLQRTLKGERLPNTEYIEKLCTCLNVFPAQRQEVKRLYSIEKIGHSTYANREYIKEMLMQFSELATQPRNPLGSNKQISIDYLQEKPLFIFNNKLGNSAVLHEIIEDELINSASPELMLNIPASENSILDLVNRVLVSSPNKPHIQHLIRFSKNPKKSHDPNYNLIALTKVLPLAFGNSNYESYFYYGHTDFSIEQEVLLPYYIITSRYLLLLSPTLDNIIVHTTEEMIKLYSDNFEFLKRKAAPLTLPIFHAQQTLKLHTDSVLADANEEMFTLEAHPCLGAYFDADLIEKKVLPNVEGRDYIIKIANVMYRAVERKKPVFQHFFSRSGLLEFIMSGHIKDMPKDTAYDFSKVELIHLLELLVRDIESDTFYCRAVDDSAITVCDQMVIYLYGHSKLMLYFTKEDGSIAGCFLSEPTIIQSFYDFFSSMEESALVLSKEETLSLLYDASETL